MMTEEEVRKRRAAIQSWIDEKEWWAHDMDQRDELLAQVSILTEVLGDATDREALTYKLIDGRIQCLICRRTSYNPNDVEQLYCGNCHKFHQRTESQP